MDKEDFVRRFRATLDNSESSADEAQSSEKRKLEVLTKELISLQNAVEKLEQEKRELDSEVLTLSAALQNSELEKKQLIESHALDKKRIVAEKEEEMQTQRALMKQVTKQWKEEQVEIEREKAKAEVHEIERQLMASKEEVESKLIELEELKTELQKVNDKEDEQEQKMSEMRAELSEKESRIRVLLEQLATVDLKGVENQKSAFEEDRKSLTELKNELLEKEKLIESEKESIRHEKLQIERERECFAKEKDELSHKEAVLKASRLEVRKEMLDLEDQRMKMKDEHAQFQEDCKKFLLIAQAQGWVPDADEVEGKDGSLEASSMEKPVPPKRHSKRNKKSSEQKRISAIGDNTGQVLESLDESTCSAEYSVEPMLEMRTDNVADSLSTDQDNLKTGCRNGNDNDTFIKTDVDAATGIDVKSGTTRRLGSPPKDRESGGANTKGSYNGDFESPTQFVRWVMKSADVTRASLKQLRSGNVRDKKHVFDNSDEAS